MQPQAPKSRPKRPAARRSAASAASHAPKSKKRRSPAPVTRAEAVGERHNDDLGSEHSSEATSDSSDVQAHLYEVQRNLDQLLRDVDHVGGGAESRRRAAEALGRIARQLGAESTDVADSTPASMRDALSLEGMARRISRHGMRHRADEVDEFGFDRQYEEHIRPLLEQAYDRYFRVRVSGAQHVPRQGRSVLVCNRGGALPVDGLLLKMAVAKQCEGERELRWLIEDFNFHAPFLGSFLNRLGAVRACQENAQRLLEHESLVAVFPEGIKGVTKLYSKRYQLQRFGRGGYVKLALRMRAPIIPSAIVGPEDAYPILYRMSALAKGLGLPFLPITPTFPWLGPLGLLPLPSRTVIIFGPPILGLDQYGPESVDDSVLVHEINERVRSTIQSLVNEACKLRGAHVYS